MLVQFSVENYLSFKERATFSLEASSISELVLENSFSTSFRNINLLRGGVLYGQNGGGKSNLFKAINFVIRFAQNSAKQYQVNEHIHVRPFKLDEISDKRPSTFEIIIITKSSKYRFGFTADQNSVLNEFLFIQYKSKEYKIYERHKESIVVEEKFSVPDQIKQFTRNNALFLSTAAMLNIEWAIDLISGFNKFYFIRDNEHQSRKGRFLDKTSELLEDPNFKPFILKFIKSVDFGIEDIKTDTLPLKSAFPNIVEAPNSIFFENSLKVISTIHNKINEAGSVVGQAIFDLDEESSGTIKYLYLAGPIIDALYYGKLLLIDEFTSHMHPLLAEAVIRLFHSPSINRNNAQLVIITHNTYLLNTDLYRRDQIFILKKSKNYSTQISNLYLEKLRKDATFEKRYLHDRELGGVPNVSTLNPNDFWLNS